MVRGRRGGIFGKRPTIKGRGCWDRQPTVWEQRVTQFEERRLIRMPEPVKKTSKWTYSTTLANKDGAIFFYLFLILFNVSAALPHVCFEQTNPWIKKFAVHMSSLNNCKLLYTLFTVILPRSTLISSQKNNNMAKRVKSTCERKLRWATPLLSNEPQPNWLPSTCISFSL